MTLGELIEQLESMDPNKVAAPGFGAPHSWRGIYSELAFEPVERTTIREMLAHARSALGATFTGWKGGEFTMDKYTKVHIEEEGTAEDRIWDYWLGSL